MLTYVSKAVLLVEIALHTHCFTAFQEILNNAALQEALDLCPPVQVMLSFESLFTSSSCMAQRLDDKIPSYQCGQPGASKN